MSIKLTFLVAFSLLLAACGFEPMYGSYAPATSAPTADGAAPVSVETALDQVQIGIIPNAEGVYLRNLLIDRFYRGGYPAAPAYTLQIGTINQTRSDLDITFESEATRRLLTVTTSMTLVDNATKSRLLERSFKVVNSYDVIGSQFSTRVGEQDALEAALADIARQVELQISLYLNRGRANETAPAAAAPIPEYLPSGQMDRPAAGAGAF